MERGVNNAVLLGVASLMCSLLSVALIFLSWVFNIPVFTASPAAARARFQENFRTKGRMSNLSLPFLDTVVNGYERLMAHGDPRVDDLLLMQGPFPITAICLFYIYFVLSLGPRLMADRKPFNLKYILLLYNLGQTIFSAVLFFLGVKQWVNTFGWGFTCHPVDSDIRTPHELLTIRLCHVYFLSKISELADTVFFVLKKKQKHISLLHVFHHAAMPFSVWFGVKFNPGGNMAFFGLPNLFVHMWMYLYYFLAALGPQYQKYIWWKRHITQMQLAQFVVVMMYMIFISLKCTLNKTLLFWTFSMDIAFVILFTDFYWRTYVKNKSVKNEAAPAKTKEIADAGSMGNGSAEKANESLCQNGGEAFTKKDL